MSFSSASARLRGADSLVLDGAIGTELESRGVPQEHDASWGECLETHPDIVHAVHVDYANAGADIITTNTYSSGLHVMEKLGLLERILRYAKFNDWNRRAVDIARQACDAAEDDRERLVAGSVSAFGNGAMRYQGTADSIRWGEEDPKRVEENFRRHAELLVDAGVDLILLELLGATIADVEIALSATSGLPVPRCVSLSCAEREGSTELFLQTTDGAAGLAHQETLDSAVEAIGSHDLSALLVHHLEIDQVDRAIDTVLRHWQGRIGVYPNRTGFWDGQKWVFEESVNPEHFADLALRWVSAGASIVGGCCGISPDHIRAVRKALPST